MASRGKSKPNLLIQLESPKTVSYLTMYPPNLMPSVPKVLYHYRRLQAGDKTHFPRPRPAPSRRRKHSHRRPLPIPLLDNSFSLNLLAPAHHLLSSPLTPVSQPDRLWTSLLLEAASSMELNRCLFPSQRQVHDPLLSLSRPRCQISQCRALQHRLTPYEAIPIPPFRHLSRTPVFVVPLSNLLDRSKLTLSAWEPRTQ